VRAIRRRHFLIVGLVVAAIGSLLAVTGCPERGRGPATLFGPAADSEHWSIRCRRIEGPGHAQQAEALAAMLRQVKQLDARKVRVASDATGSNLYYGDYRRIASPSTGQLVFPPELQQQIEFIRSLSPDGASTPFFTAQPELVENGPPSQHPDWEAANARSTHSLRVAVFYNTPTFTERREAAEQYVAILRQDGFPAYYHHEPVKSYVFVGDFSAGDILMTPEGPRPGPRVDQLIASREEEFRYFTENGHIRKRLEGNRAVATPSEVVELPKKK
jgi:hypothetical protein